jgi:hypothetical protein
MRYLDITIEISIDKLLNAEDSELNPVADRFPMLAGCRKQFSLGHKQWATLGSFQRKRKVGIMLRRTVNVATLHPALVFLASRVLAGTSSHFLSSHFGPSISQPP